MKAQIVWCSTAGPRENMSEVHTATCSDALRTARRQHGHIERVDDFPDSNENDADTRYMADLAFYEGAFDNQEWPDFTVMPCVEKERR